MTDETKDINITVEVGETVPVAMYTRLEHRFNQMQSAMYNRTLELENANRNLTLLLREIAPVIKDDNYYQHLVDMYTPTFKTETV